MAEFICMCVCLFVCVYVRTNLENGLTDFDNSFFVGNLRTPINTWATFFAVKIKTKGQKRSKTGQKWHFFMFFARFRRFLEKLSAEIDYIW